MTERALTTKVTWNFADGDIVTTAEVAPGVLIGGGWGVTRVEVVCRHPVHVDFLQAFLEATANVIVTGGIRDLIARHDVQDAADR